MHKFFIYTLFTFCNMLSFGKSVINNKKVENLVIELYYGDTHQKLATQALSLVLNDNNNPFFRNGLEVKIKLDNNYLLPNQYQLTLTGDNELVVPQKSIRILPNSNSTSIYIQPTTVGYCNITLQCTFNKNSGATILALAVSNNITTNAPVFWHTGMADGSNAIDLSDSTFATADDEKNEISIFYRYKSGPPIKVFEYGKYLRLNDCRGGVCSECDIESATKSSTNPNRIYWLSSMSNGKAPKSNNKPNRNRLFATDILPDQSFHFIGYYDQLKEALIQYGNQNGYSLGNSAMAGMDPKEIDGFNIEGMCFSPDNTTLFVTCRAPLVPKKNREKALIIPIINFETWFNNGQPQSKPSFGPPLELNLNKRGVRDIIKLSNNKLLIVAGNFDGNVFTSLYLWDGNAENQPTLLPSFKVTYLNIEGVMEIKNNHVLDKNKLQVICDNGKQVYYDDGQEAKDLSQPAFKKFTSIIISTIEPSL